MSDSSDIENLDMDQYPRAIRSAMAAFEIAVIEWGESSKSEHFWKKLRIARKECASQLEAMMVKERIDELEQLAAYSTEPIGLIRGRHQRSFDDRIAALQSKLDKEKE